jgi:aminoglycoside phosphotransferase (APT) family kinase protein
MSLSGDSRMRRRRPPPTTLRWVEGAIGPGSLIVSHRAFRTGGWHVNHALTVRDGQGQVVHLVLRRWARLGWEADDPDYTAEREVAVLGVLAHAEFPAPRLVADDPDAARCDVPTLLLSRLPGHPPGAVHDLDGFVVQLAGTLARLHEIDGGAGSLVPPYHTYFEPSRAVSPPWLRGSQIWKRTTAVVRRPPPPSEECFIHRDYHPENTLWSRGRLTGVVDWTQSSWGPPELDVGHMRWNLAADHGLGVADRFPDAYRATSGRALADQPYWDLVTLLDLVLVVDPADPFSADDLAPLETYAAAILGRL